MLKRIRDQVKFIKMREEICVIGLGKFGRSVVETLIKLKKDIVIIDKEEKKINEFSEIVNNCFCLDATDKESLEEAGLNNFKNVVIGIGSDPRASFYCASILFELGAQNIIAKIIDERHEKIMEQIGVRKENLIRPEIEAGKQVAYKVFSIINNTELINLDEEYAITNIILKNSFFIEKNLKILDLPKNYNVNVVIIKRKEQVVLPTSETKFLLNDKITFVGKNKDVIELYNLLKKNT